VRFIGEGDLSRDPSAIDDEEVAYNKAGLIGE
jgi:hypothetical protein